MLRRLLRWLAILVTIAVASFVLIPAPAWAADTIDPGNTVATIRLSAFAVTLLASTVIPIITGLLTRAPSRIKGLVTLILNAISTLVATATLGDGTALISAQTLITWLVATAASVTTYLGIWKPAGVTSSPGGKLADIGRR